MGRPSAGEEEVEDVAADAEPLVTCNCQVCDGCAEAMKSRYPTAALAMHVHQMCEHEARALEKLLGEDWRRYVD